MRYSLAVDPLTDDPGPKRERPKRRLGSTGAREALRVTLDSPIRDPVKGSILLARSSGSVLGFRRRQNSTASPTRTKPPTPPTTPPTLAPMGGELLDVDCEDTAEFEGVPETVSDVAREANSLVVEVVFVERYSVVYAIKSKRMRDAFGPPPFTILRKCSWFAREVLVYTGTR